MNDKIEILVVEDDYDVREMLKEFFIYIPGNYNYMIVENATLAQETIEAREIDLVVTDLDMNGFDGRDLIKWIKSEDQYKSIPVVAMSGRSKEEGIQFLNDNLVVAFIAKPFTLKLFAAGIARHLQ